MAEKVTIMKLKVDLECEKCYKKVKKLLAKYPQIRDQKIDKKENIVWITVVCCSPEKIRDKLCKKGGGSIKSIEILEPPKPPEKKKDEPKPPEKKKEEPKPEKTKEPEKKKEESKPEKTKEPEKKKKEEPKPEKTKEPEKKEEPKPEKTKESKPDPVPVYPPVPPPMAVPVGMICCGPCYEGRPGGPCVDGFVGPAVYYDGYYGRPVYDSYGGGRPYYYASRCDQYFSEENPSGCTIM